MVKDLIKQQFRALEAIVANPNLPVVDKVKAMRMYERFLSRQTGITLRALKEAGHIVRYKGLSKTQVLNELRALENIFVEGALKSAREVGTPLTRAECREMFSNYVDQHFKIKIGRELRKKRIETIAKARKAKTGQAKVAKKVVRKPRPRKLRP